MNPQQQAAQQKAAQRQALVERCDQIYDKFKTHTMIPRRKYRSNLMLCRQFAPPEGLIVECGVWKGGMSAGMADIMPGRTHYLFDSFEGLPPAKEIDGQRALDYQADPNSDNCNASIEDADAVMRRSAAGRYELIKGWFSDTLPKFRPTEGIAVLRMDGDWYDSTWDTLENLFPLVVQNGLILIDDYRAWVGCSRAVHDYLSRNQREECIRESPENTFYIRKVVEGQSAEAIRDAAAAE